MPAIPVQVAAGLHSAAASGEAHSCLNALVLSMATVCCWLSHRRLHLYLTLHVLKAKESCSRYLLSIMHAQALVDYLHAPMPFIIGTHPAYIAGEEIDP